MNQNSNAGFTLVELSMVILILGVLSIAVTSAVRTSVDAATEINQQLQLDNDVRRTFQVLATELRHSDADTITLDETGTALEYAPITGWKNGEPVLGTARKIALAEGSLWLDDKLVVKDRVADGEFRFEDGDLILDLSMQDVVIRGGKKVELTRKVSGVIQH